MPNIQKCVNLLSERYGEKVIFEGSTYYLFPTLDTLKTLTLEIKVKAGENGKIFGGVTAKEISESLNEKHKIEIDKKKIVLNEPIKNIGIFQVEIKLFEGITGKLKVEVTSI